MEIFIEKYFRLIVMLENYILPTCIQRIFCTLYLFSWVYITTSYQPWLSVEAWWNLL